MLTDRREFVNALWYGDGGTGKTTALAGMANLGKVLLINAEGGVKRRPLEQRGISVGNIEVFPSGSDVISIESLLKEWQRIREELDKDPGAYIGFVIDSITDLYQALLRNVVNKAVIAADRANKERDAYFIEQGDYGKMTEQVRDVMRKLRDLPCHLGVSALPRRQQDPDGTVVYVPAVSPALQNDLDLWMDVVCHTEVMMINGKEEYRGTFRPTGLYRGKDRFSVLPKGLVDPSFDRVVAYIEGDIDLDSDQVMIDAKARRQDVAAEVAVAAAAA
jgi:hypothetical protein